MTHTREWREKWKPPTVPPVYSRGANEKRRKIKLSKDALARLYIDEGCSSKQIANRLGVSAPTVLEALHRVNIQIRNATESKVKLRISREELFRLYWVEHKRAAEIAAKYGCRPSTIIKTMRRLSVPRRTRMEANALWLSSRQPSKPELMLAEIIRGNDLPFRYVGDGRELIGGLCPDFISTNHHKRIIEVFGEVFHDPSYSFNRVTRWKSAEWGRKAFFKSHGYDMMVIWQSELQQNPIAVIDKVKAWHNENFRRVGLGTIVYETAKIIATERLTLGRDVTIGDGVLLNCGKSTVIGDGSQINGNTVIAGGGKLVVGKHVTIGYGALILTGTDCPDGRFMVDSIPEGRPFRRVRRDAVRIGDEAFVGSHAIVMPGARLGKRAVVGAHAYVDQKVSDNMMLIPRCAATVIGRPLYEGLPNFTIRPKDDLSNA